MVLRLASISGCVQFELHFPDVLQRLAYLVACLHGQVAIIGKTIKPLDDLITFTFHLTSRSGLGNTLRGYPSGLRYDFIRRHFNVDNYCSGQVLLPQTILPTIHLAKLPGDLIIAERFSIE